MTREEAINKIREAMPTLWKDTKDAIQVVIPELAENEDEKIRNEIITSISIGVACDESALYPGAKYTLKDALAWLEKRKEVDWEEELEKCKKNPLYFTKNYVRFQQKPVEWSEEDEYCRNQLIVFCENCMQQDSAAIRCANWLKSLRPQPRWKPTEEQMKALKVNVDRLIMQFPGKEIVLKSLYDGLKNYFNL